MTPQLALITAPNMEIARTIATALLDVQLAACVNIIPGIESHYVWQGKRCTDAEVLLIAKTDFERKAEFEDCVKKSHTYECPEIVFIAPDAIETQYGRWWHESIG